MRIRLSELRRVIRQEAKRLIEVGEHPRSWARQPPRGISSPRTRSRGKPIAVEDAYAQFPDAMRAYDEFAWLESSDGDPDWPQSERQAAAQGDSDASFFVESGKLVVRSISSDDWMWDGSKWAMLRT